MQFCTCETRGCRRQLDLAPCDTCQRLVCPADSVPAGHDKRRCHGCAKSTQIWADSAQIGAAPAQPQQLDFFSRVRPRGKRPAHDGLVK